MSYVFGKPWHKDKDEEEDDNNDNKDDNNTEDDDNGHKDHWEDHQKENGLSYVGFFV